ncbi:MAG: class I SAM-dependent methyltransferase [Flavobacteriaceae bacterium]
MTQASLHDSWSAGRSYDHYMGRWSRLVAEKFVDWLAGPEDADWADIGCGTGALTSAILTRANPASVIGIDPSEGFVNHARNEIADSRAQFKAGDAQAIPLPDDAVDVAASALVLNFVPDRLKALAEMRRVTRDGGTIAFYVWDYPGGGMGIIDRFWKAAAILDPAARELNEADRFPFCSPAGLSELCVAAGFDHPAVHPIEVESVFSDFEAFWHPFTLGAGPAPGYCMSMPADARERLKRELMNMLGGEGEVRLIARAWAVRLAGP